MFQSRILKIISAFLLFELVLCRSTGPPLPQICDPDIQLIPQHRGTAPQITAAPFSVDIENTSYIAGATINSKKCSNFSNRNLSLKNVIEFLVVIRANGIDNDVSEFRGFMIQARPSEDGSAFGTFRLSPNDNKAKLFGCPDNGTLVRMSKCAP